MKFNHIYGAIVGAVIVLVGVHALTVQQVRVDARQDLDVSEAVNVLNQAVESTYAKSGELPEEQSDVLLTGKSQDIVERSEVTYKKNDAGGYTICAVFNRQNDGRDFSLSPWNTSFEDYGYSLAPAVDPYTHSAGENCFDYDATDNLYYDANAPADSSSDEEGYMQLEDIESLFSPSSQNFDFQ